MSQRSLFAADKPIRGGVPLIFPWFGARTGHPESPAHGFARTSEWQIESLTEDGDGVVIAAFHLSSDDPHPRALALRLRAALPRRHRSHPHPHAGSGKTPPPKPFPFEDALHTYFAVSDVRETSTAGLENADYVDKTDAQQRKNQGPDLIRITSETDRVYESTRKTCIVDDPGLHRKITIEKSGSQTTVVWNPWIAKFRHHGRLRRRRMAQNALHRNRQRRRQCPHPGSRQNHSTRAIVSVANRGFVLSEIGIDRWNN